MEESKTQTKRLSVSADSYTESIAVSVCQAGVFVIKERANIDLR